MKFMRSNLRGISFICFLSLMTMLSAQNAVYAGVVEKSKVNVKINSSHHSVNRWFAAPSSLSMLIATSIGLAARDFLIGIDVADRQQAGIYTSTSGREFLTDNIETSYNSMDFTSFDN